jgi:hypothetical protein
MSAGAPGKSSSSSSEVEEEKHSQESESIPIQLVADLKLAMSDHLVDTTKPMFEWILGAPIIKTMDTFHDNRVPAFVGFDQRWREFREAAWGK